MSTAPTFGRRRLGRLGPNIVTIICGLFFLLPLLALARFALQNVPTILLGASTLFKKWSFKGVTKAFNDPGFGPAFSLSLKLTVGTVLVTLLLLIPTAVWVHLRLPRARAFVEFLTLLPYVIPPIALVAGILIIKPHARWFLDSDLALIPFYVVLALPFTYRSLDAGLRALDLKTLVDASRSLGAGWGTTLRRAIVPNLRIAIISSAFLTAAVVLGEYTLANVLLVEALPRFIATYRQREPQAGYGLALLSLVGTTALFVVLGVATRKRGSKKASTAPKDASADTTPIALAGLSGRSGTP